MFTWLNKQGVRSDLGFEVQRTSRFEAEYRENGKTVSLHVESGIEGGLQCILIDPEAFLRWDDGQPISADQQRQIRQNFEDAMAFQGLKTLVQSGEVRGR